MAQLTFWGKWNSNRITFLWILKKQNYSLTVVIPGFETRSSKKLGALSNRPYGN